MENKNVKKGFLLYFDSYPAIAALGAEQRGLLLSALYVYADRVWRDETVSMEEILDQFPAMDGQTRTACGFMGANILRDTRKWLSQRELRSQRRQEQGRGRGEAPLSAAERLQREREDMERSGRLLQALKEKERSAARRLGQPSLPGQEEKDLTMACLSGMMRR